MHKKHSTRTFSNEVVAKPSPADHSEHSATRLRCMRKNRRFRARSRTRAASAQGEASKTINCITERASHCPRYVLAIKVGGVACSPRGVCVVRKETSSCEMTARNQTAVLLLWIRRSSVKSLARAVRAYRRRNGASRRTRISQRPPDEKAEKSVPPEVRSFSQNRELAAEAGRKGGLARGSSMREGAAREAAKSHSYETEVGHDEEAIPQPNEHGSVPDPQGWRTVARRALRRCVVRSARRQFHCRRAFVFRCRRSR